MTRKISRLSLAAALAIGATTSMAPVVHAEDSLVPYKMLRSLQFVQDSVILGDHSAAEMQRFLLADVDQRLRNVDPTVYDDPRNVDAALIYAMSGGNPETLEYLVARDVEGRFDTRVADALRKYLDGKGTLVAKTLATVALEYRDTPIGPYLALVSANATLPKDSKAAIQFYDLARLGAPGTIIEESALRRSIAISASTGNVRRGLDYAGRYARRFLHSPYASQFADLFVVLAVDNFGQVSESDIITVLAPMDNERRKEVYLRIARKATIQGKTELAKLASAQALALSSDANESAAGLAAIYGGFAVEEGEDIGAAMKNIIENPDDLLTPRDRALSNAARLVAEEVLRAPDPAILPTSALATEGADGGDQDPTAGLPAAVAPDVADDGKAEPAAADADALGEEHKSFVTSGRSKLDEIDKLLEKEGVLP